MKFLITNERHRPSTYTWDSIAGHWLLPDGTPVFYEKDIDENGLGKMWWHCGDSHPVWEMITLKDNEEGA